MQTPEPNDLIAQIADAQGDITLSLQRVLSGVVAKLGGPEQLGRIIGEMIEDTELTIAARVSLVNNVTRLMGQYGESDSDNGLLDEEQITARLRALDRVSVLTDVDDAEAAT